MRGQPAVDPSAVDLARAIGVRVRKGRKLRGWTLDQLATAAGVSRRMLINVEQGAANPSVGTLLRISDALGVGLPALVEPAVPSQMHVTRRGEGAALWQSAGGGRGVLMAGTGPPDVVELWDWTLVPNDRHESESHTPGTKELLQILEGTVLVEVGDQSITLNEGDAIAFAGDLPHAYSNPAATKARFTLTVFEPGVGVADRSATHNAWWYTMGWQ